MFGGVIGDDHRVQVVFQHLTVIAVADRVGERTPEFFQDQLILIAYRRNLHPDRRRAQGQTFAASGPEYPDSNFPCHKRVLSWFGYHIVYVIFS